MSAQFGQTIREKRKKAGFTQEKLAKAAEISVMSLRRYESNERQPSISVIDKIAAALGLVRGDFLETEPSPDAAEYFWSADLEDKLKQVGCSTGFDEDNAILWINYPDGILEVSDDDLKELHDSTNEYLRFKLQELKKRRAQDFRPKGNKS